ncbi:MAG: glycoside hydrolase [Bacteroidales bacterium]|jgi:sialidase-1|nr:glycoside hydrolase [Bacteroidales bacterium]MCI2121557.1 glycoside hydrolase [Bacteroidales bacterium]MCI2145070.1 glycoside hydrolase [Bacteroidales bacterium]
MKKTFTIVSSLLAISVLTLSFSCDDWKFKGSGESNGTDTTSVTKKDTGKLALPDDGKLVASTAYESGTDDHVYYRIPALIETPKHALLAFCEARNTKADFYEGNESQFTVTPVGSSKDRGDIDLVFKRSEDGGATWSNMQTIVDDKQNTCGNPVPVVEQSTGRIYLFWCWQSYPSSPVTSDLVSSADGKARSRRVFYCYSDDDGKTWSSQADASPALAATGWSWIATGPGHGIQKSEAPHAGRLVIPANHRENGNTDNYSHCYYSDDKGKTWHISGNTDLGGNESQIAELENGDLLINMRLADYDADMRASSLSTDGGTTWETMKLNSDLPDPGCQGSVSNYLSDGKPSETLLLSNVKSANVRSNLCISKSTDCGTTWTKAYTVYSSRAAYSDLIVLSDGSVAVLYEYGNGKYGKANPNEYIGFIRIPKSLTGTLLGIK